MFKVKFVGGGEYVSESGEPISVYDAAKAAGLISRDVIAAVKNGENVDLTHEISSDCEIKLATFADPAGKEAFNHTASHIMAQAVKRLYPDAKLTIGPAIEDGFYYDIDRDEPFTQEDLPKIEEEMQKIVSANYKLTRFTLPRDEAIALMKEKGETYKVLLIERIPEGEESSFYSQGEFIDLCAGPHLYSTGLVKAFKLTSLTGAYWEGDSKNKMLRRIYGVAFPNKAMLAEYLERIEEVKKRDHRKIGRDLDLFDIYEEGQGFPFFLPKGMVLCNLLEDFWREEHRKAGYEEIKTPIILSRSLWERSGHWDHYNNNMYTTKIDDEDYAIKPMNCPGGILVFKRRLWSYRDLPIRCGELGLVHRHELSGTLHGLMRVRCFTQDDAHIFMRPDQIRDEIKGVYNLIDKVYKMFGFNYKVELSTRPENSIGTDEMWELATDGLRGALDELGVDYTVNEGDGAFYGPKVDFHLEDCLGRTWQCGTIQLDMNLPERFDLTYIGADNEKHRPVMIHRVVFGSIERFIAILTEHFAGAFPLWLAPVQVKVMSIRTEINDYAKEVYEKLKAAGLRAELDDRNEKIGYKVREAQLQKIPYMLVVGDREQQNATVSVRSRREENKAIVMSIDEFIAKAKNEVETKSL
ncbi:MAG: threonine--tRNA ligase [Clostridiales bacterium]|jgi:threonyl-tRNA synthetase|nr:threonine--tRNA ligase [Clostridiales bacterium]